MIATELVLSAQAQVLRDSWEVSDRPWDVPVAQARHAMREQARVLGGEAEAVASIEDVDAGGVPARLYRPRGGEPDVLVWLHGGGFTVGDVGCYEALACALANRAGCAVLSVEYRLAPEHRCPAAIEDSWAATAWAAERFAQTAVGGDSAGGNLAAAVALRARDAGVALALQLLVYPMLDPRLDAPFVDEFVARYASFAGMPAYGATAREGIRRVWETYAPDPLQLREQDVAPALAASLAGAAAALVVLAEHDLLRGEGEAYARRLAAEGVPVELRGYAHQLHGFFHLVGAMDDARDAVERSAAALRRAFTSSARRAR